MVRTANLCTKILDFRWFDSSISLNLWGGILMSIGDFLEILSQAILAGINLCREIGLSATRAGGHPPAAAAASAAASAAAAAAAGPEPLA